MSAKPPSISKSSRRLLWLLLIVSLVVSFIFVITPAILIQPFRPQTTRAVEVSYLLKSWSPFITLVALVISVAFAFLLWNNARRWWRKTVLVILLLLALPPAWFARQNHFEWMFNPLRNRAYASVSDVNFVNDSDMVLAVNIGKEAVAYPVRLMAYHHLVQDTVGGVPLVATY